MYYAIVEAGSYDTLHVFEDRDERDEFAREHDAFVCTYKEAHSLLEREVLIRNYSLLASEVRDLTMDDLISTLIECDDFCKLHDNGLVELSRVTLHWEW